MDSLTKEPQKTSIRTQVVVVAGFEEARLKSLSSKSGCLLCQLFASSYECRNGVLTVRKPGERRVGREHGEVHFPVLFGRHQLIHSFYNGYNFYHFREITYDPSILGR